MKNTHDLFLLMFNLSQMRDKDKIIRFFQESITDLFDPQKFSFAEQIEEEISFVEEIASGDFSYGYIFSTVEPSLEIKRLVQNAVQMLAVILDRLSFENKLKIKADAYESIAQKRSDEIHIYIEELESARLASLNLISDLKDEIAERTKVEKALTSSEEKFRLAFQTSPDSIAINRLSDGLYIDINEGFTSATGYTANEIIGKTSLELNIWEDLEARIKLSTGLKDHGKVENLEAIFKKKDGSLMAGLMSASIIALNDEPHLISITRDISEIKAAQEELRKSETHFRTVFENSATGMCLTSIEGEFLQVNTKLCQILGYSNKELINSSFQRITHPEDKEISANFVAGAIENNKDVLRFEKRYLRKNGETLWGEISSSLIRNAEAKPLYFITHIIDITERKHAVESLKNSEERYRMLLTNLEAGVVVHAPDTSIVLNNKRASELLGLSDAQLAGKLAIDPEWKFIHENNVPFQLEEYPVNKIVATKKAIKNLMLGVLRPATKDIVWLVVNGFPVLNQKGDLEEVLISFIDITERKNAEEALFESYAFMQSIIEQSPHPMWISDEKGTLIRINPACCNLLHINSEEVIGKYTIFQDNIIEEQGFMPDVKAVFEQGKTARFELIYESTKLKSLHLKEKAVVTLSVTIFPIKDKYGKITNAAIQHVDITEKKLAEEEIQKLNQGLELRVHQRTTQLEIANKEMESFIYSVSHDLRAPLRSIMGFSQIISKRHKASLNEEGTEYFGYILEASNNMANLIEDLLSFSRLAKTLVDKESIPLDEVLQSVIQNLTQDILEKNAKIILPDKMPIIKGDRSLLGQIFTNLIQNAIMYHREGIDPEIIFSIVEDNENMIVRVKDNSSGIPEEHHEKIFNIFQRLHSNDKYPGTGIGLSIVKKAVAAHGGSITVESEVGTGSTFSVKLPKI